MVINSIDSKLIDLLAVLTRHKTLKQSVVLDKHAYLRYLRWQSMQALLWRNCGSELLQLAKYSRISHLSLSTDRTVPQVWHSLLWTSCFFSFIYHFCVLSNQHAIRDCWHNTPFKLFSFTTRVNIKSLKATK